MFSLAEGSRGLSGMFAGRGGSVVLGGARGLGGRPVSEPTFQGRHCPAGLTVLEKQSVFWTHRWELHSQVGQASCQESQLWVSRASTRPGTPLSPHCGRNQRDNRSNAQHLPSGAEGSCFVPRGPWQTGRCRMLGSCRCHDGHDEYTGNFSRD